MDSLLKNGPHINKITSSCYCKLHDIAKIRPCLETKSAQLIVQALVLSNIDYCNSLLAGSSQYQLDKLQCIQNMSCQVICNIRKHDHVSPAKKCLHWLKIPERITYKLCLLVYKCQNNLAPKYLSDLLPSNPPSLTISMYLASKIANANTHLLALLDPEPGILFLQSSRMPSPYMFLRLYSKRIYLTFLTTSNLYFITFIYLTFYLF